MKKEKVCVHAAKLGDLELLSQLYSDGYPLTKRAAYVAAQSGHIDILQWLRDKSIFWNGNVCDEKVAKIAIEAGHLPVVQWVVRHGIAVTWWMVVASIRSHNIQMVDWTWTWFKGY